MWVVIVRIRFGTGFTESHLASTLFTMTLNIEMWALYSLLPEKLLLISFQKQWISEDGEAF